MLGCKTKAIAIHHTKFSDHKIVAKLFTQELGMTSFLVRLPAKKPGGKLALYRPFSLLEIDYHKSPKSNLLTIKEESRAGAFRGFQGDVSKSSVVLFLTEILYKSLEESYVNQPLFDFIWKAIEYLDESDDAANFHLIFLFYLSKLYGFGPQMPESYQETRFNLETGRFQIQERGEFVMNARYSSLWKELLGTKFADMNTLNLSTDDRRIVLRFLVDYFRLHLSGIKEINSHAILETVFHA